MDLKHLSDYIVPIFGVLIGLLTQVPLAILCAPIINVPFFAILISEISLPLVTFFILVFYPPPFLVSFRPTIKKFIQHRLIVWQLVIYTLSSLYFLINILKSYWLLVAEGRVCKNESPWSVYIIPLIVNSMVISILVEKIIGKRCRFQFPKKHDGEKSQ